MYCKNESDETLVMLTLAGEQSAYEVLVTRYQRAVIASAASVTKTEFLAEDAAQDAFVTAWMKLDTLAEPKKYGSWVCRIAKNCALNTVSRYRSFLPLETVDNLAFTADHSQNPAELYVLSEERERVGKTVEALPEKVRTVIHLHYFEGLSIAEIADRMRISEGTVKWQLHDGRKRIRKELCAMDEKYGDTLVQRVIKKVEELKLWQVKNDKTGFDTVYKDVLRQVEELPECVEKHHALADVLMRGWWWLPGDKNDALFARIAKAAADGKNEEVMAFIVAREDSSVYRGARIDFIRDKQIPRLEQAGFVKTLGREWFWLGNALYGCGRTEEGSNAYDKAEQILSEGDAYRVLASGAKRLEEIVSERYGDTLKEHYAVICTVEEYRVIDGETVYFTEEECERGYLGSIDQNSLRIFRNASCCDGRFTADVPVGESFVGTDGTVMTHLSDNELVSTPAGDFDNCQLWEIRRWTDQQKIVCRTYYKDGIGIVRQERTADALTETLSLSAFNIKGGCGIMPLSPGNSWEYVTGYSPDVISTDIKIAVEYSDGKRILVSSFVRAERLKYDEGSFLEAAQQIANEYAYHNENANYWYINDVSDVIERAERLAATPMEKAHIKAAASVARRIMETDTTFNPGYTAEGIWNFFEREYLRKKKDVLTITSYNSRWSFEWKGGTVFDSDEAVFQNDILGILRDASNCIWSEEWRIGASPIAEYTKWDRTIRTEITCEDGGTVTTKAGSFENCFKLCLDISGPDAGWSYRGGKKVYYFADGIGIVRFEAEYSGGAKTVVYELTSYTGTGEGFMPICDGLVRRYDAIDLTDGFVSSAEYTFVSDGDGDIVIFTDRTGMRVLPPKFTQYSSILGEEIEQKLWDEGKWQEGHMKYAENCFHIIQHLIARPSRNMNNAKRSIEIHTFYMKLMELLGEDGRVPEAWYCLYAWSALIRAAALFGDGRREDGYSSLDTAIDYCERIKAFKTGDLLDTGNKQLFGDAKVEYGKGTISLPDGSRDPMVYYYRMNWGVSDLYYCLIAGSGWEWFDSVRKEERFEKCVERAKRIADK